MPQLIWVTAATAATAATATARAMTQVPPPPLLPAFQRHPVAPPQPARHPAPAVAQVPASR